MASIQEVGGTVVPTAEQARRYRAAARRGLTTGWTITLDAGERVDEEGFYRNLREPSDADLVRRLRSLSGDFLEWLREPRNVAAFLRNPRRTFDDFTEGRRPPSFPPVQSGNTVVVALSDREAYRDDIATYRRIVADWARRAPENLKLLVADPTLAVETAFGRDLAAGVLDRVLEPADSTGTDIQET